MESQLKKSHHQDVSKISWLQQFFRGKYLDELTRDVIARVGELKFKETSPATANRLLALIRSILRKAALDWEWIDRPPVIKLYRESSKHARMVDDLLNGTFLAQQQ